MKLSKDHKPGFVYLIEIGGYTKIGSAAFAWSMSEAYLPETVRRRRELAKVSCLRRIRMRYQTHNPEPVAVSAVFVSNCRTEETALHKKFKRKLHRGEWYSLDEKDLDYVDSYLSKKAV